MFSDEFFAAIKADREREIRAAQRARLVQRDPLDGEPARIPPAGDRRSIGHTVRPAGQPGRTSADPSR
jgi:hypothetical protein